MFCKEQVAQLRPTTEAIHANGAELVVVGNGDLASARRFARETGLSTPLYVDAQREAYRALGMRRDVTSALNPAFVGNAWRALRAGFRQTSVQGDPWQMGGVLLVLPGGQVVYRYLSSAAGDHPPVAELLAALAGAAERTRA
jgi:AhpC/TSA antioxidant enzyme